MRLLLFVCICSLLLVGCGGVPVVTAPSAPNAPAAKVGSNETLLHSFDFSNGAYNLYAGLLFDSAGNLYGTTQSGGDTGCNLAESCGVVFELTHGANGNWTEKLLHVFSPNDLLGFWPRGGLTMDSKGDLYGTASSSGPYCAGSVGCGTVFELSPNASGTWKAKVIYGFRGGFDGSSPQGTLIFDKAGNLYGSTAEGGKDDDGTIFQLVRQRNGSWARNILHSFTNREGSEPNTPAFDKAGNLYGTTTFGGSYRTSCTFYGCGTAFELKPGSNNWSLKILHVFGKGIDGVSPVSALTVDSAGNLFGVTAQGGPHSSLVPHACLLYGCGTAFELVREKRDSWRERIIHNFGSGTDGSLPRGDLILDDRGALYGTTVLGGARGAGDAFQLTLRAGGTWTETVLHDFGKGKDGVNPYSGMIFDDAHNLYGTTATGGSYRGGSCLKSGGCGTIFEMKSPAQR